MPQDFGAVQRSQRTVFDPPMQLRFSRMRNTRRSQGRFQPEHLPAFFAAADIDDPFRQIFLQQRLEEIANLSWQQFGVSTVSASNKSFCSI